MRLGQCATGELPAGVNDRIGQLRRDGGGGMALRDALVELEARLVPVAPPPTTSIAAAATGGIKVACSMSPTYTG